MFIWAVNSSRRSACLWGGLWSRLVRVGSVCYCSSCLLWLCSPLLWRPPLLLRCFSETSPFYSGFLRPVQNECPLFAHHAMLALKHCAPKATAVAPKYFLITKAKWRLIMKSLEVSEMCKIMQTSHIKLLLTRFSSSSCSYRMPIVPHWEGGLGAHPLSMIWGSVTPVFFPPTIILWAFTPHGFQTQFLVQSNIPNSLNSSPIVQDSDISQFLASINNVIENIIFLAVLKLLFFHCEWWVYVIVLCMHQVSIPSAWGWPHLHSLLPERLRKSAWFTCVHVLIENVEFFHFPLPSPLLLKHDSAFLDVVL